MTTTTIEFKNDSGEVEATTVIIIDRDADKMLVSLTVTHPRPMKDETEAVRFARHFNRFIAQMQ